MSRDLVVAENATVARTALTPMVWGTTYIVSTELLPTGRPLLAAMLRALPIGVVFLLWTRTLPSGSWWWRAAVLGFLNIGAFFALLFVAAFRLPGGVAATAGALQPVVAAVLAAILLGELFTRRIAVAGLLGVGGVALLVLSPEAALDPVGVVAALLGTMSMAAGVVLTKYWTRPVDLITFTGWQLTAGGLLLVPVVLVAEGLPSSVSGTNLVGFVWLGVFGTGLAYANWFRGIGALAVSVTSFLALLSPLVATLAGWLVLDQRLTTLQAIGAVLVLIAVVLPQLRLSAGARSTNADATTSPGAERNTDEGPDTDALGASGAPEHHPEPAAT
ncbi:MAG: EamA family transporter [Actinomycetota bacterium]